MVNVLCDHCEKNLNESSYNPDYRVVLTGQAKALPASGIAFAMAGNTWPDETKHFCNRKCLTAWLETH